MPYRSEMREIFDTENAQLHWNHGPLTCIKDHALRCALTCPFVRALCLIFFLSLSVFLGVWLCDACHFNIWDTKQLQFPSVDSTEVWIFVHELSNLLDCRQWFCGIAWKWHIECIKWMDSGSNSKSVIKTYMWHWFYTLFSRKQRQTARLSVTLVWIVS